MKSLADSLTKSASSHPPMIMRRLKSTLNIENFPKKILRPIEETTLLMPEVQNYAYLDVTNKLNRKELKSTLTKLLKIHGVKELIPKL